MNDIPHPLTSIRYRQGFYRLAKRIHFTHWLTLNTHDECTMATALKHLKRWRVEVFRRVHGQRFYLNPVDSMTTYIGCPEYSAAGHPHFHLGVGVPAGFAEKFERHACTRWNAMLPKATSDLASVGPSTADQGKVLSYTTKWLNPMSPLPFVHSQTDW